MHIPPLGSIYPPSYMPSHSSRLHSLHSPRTQTQFSFQITLSTRFNSSYVTHKFTIAYLSTYLIIWRCRLNRSSHHKANVAARLTQHCCHLLRAHTSQINFSNLQDVISTLQTIVLCNRTIMLQHTGCPTEHRTQTHGKLKDITSTPYQQFLEKNFEQYLISCSPGIKHV